MFLLLTRETLIDGFRGVTGGVLQTLAGEVLAFTTRHIRSSSSASLRVGSLCGAWYALTWDRHIEQVTEGHYYYKPDNVGYRVNECADKM